MLAAGRGTRRCRFVGGCGILELPYCVCACVRAHSARWVRVCVCACALSPMGICTLLDKSACIAEEIRISLVSLIFTCRFKYASLAAIRIS